MNDVTNERRGMIARVLVLAVSLVLVTARCGEDPISPDSGPTGQGRIAGSAFLRGNPEQTPQIKIDILVTGGSEVVSTVYPNDQGRFQSDLLNGGTYDLIATVNILGYFPARVPNIIVVPGRTTELVQQIDIPDTSSVRFENLNPRPGVNLVERRPTISGEFRSEGSGFKIETFALTINRVRVTQGLDVDEIRFRRHGSFSYQPPGNLRPGLYEAEAFISTRDGDLFTQPWSFRILEGVARRVPGVYPTIVEAVSAANDGDSILVAPGTYEATNIWVDKDLTFLSESGREVTTLRAGAGARLFEVSGDNLPSLSIAFQGLTLTGGYPGTGSGGAIVSDEARITVEDCAFIDNLIEGVGKWGGALALSESDATVRACVFTENTGYRGGAIAAYNRSSLLVDRCVFIRNVNYDQGGAIYIKSVEVEVTLSTFYRNDAGDGVGGAIMVDGVAGDAAQLRSEGNLYIENQARSGAIYFKDSNITSECDGFHDNRGGIITGFGGNAYTVDLLDVPAQVDPGFCDLAGDDLRLRPDSPFLDNGCERGALPVGCGP